ncbi:glycerate kinase [Marinoscillum sp. MHG1-6]|uniref:glycerate kinase n=1 Tax=Marinoscillum sp. MHG1-6 TaxID=2959627 RepID=UPI002156FEB0|nr:glycerate kinase [Marinoscillum sp. MHG1-6]
MNVLISPNAFKGALNANEVALAIEAGLKRSSHEFQIIRLPIADGGDGTLSILAEACKARLFTDQYPDPLGREVTASYGWMERENVAIVEMAEASGIRHLNTDELNPWVATSCGTGVIIKEAVEKGAKEIWLSVGGSASVDGGMGLLEALGVVFYDADGSPIHGVCPEKFFLIDDIDVSEASNLLDGVSIQVFCDVSNPLLGEEGAARVFGPQKGASMADVPKLELALAHLNNICLKKTGSDVSAIKHGGAAGGISAFLHGFLNAELLDGASNLLDKVGFHQKLQWADVVITGEGKIDSQTLSGKGPGLVAYLANKAGKYVVGICGEAEVLVDGPFNELLSINHPMDNLLESMRKTGDNLEIAARKLGDRLRQDL